MRRACYSFLPISPFQHCCSDDSDHALVTPLLSTLTKHIYRVFTNTQTVFSEPIFTECYLVRCSPVPSFTFISQTALTELTISPLLRDLRHHSSRTHNICVYSVQPWQSTQWGFLPNIIMISLQVQDHVPCHND